MPAPVAAPFGSWSSPITGELLVQASVSLGGPALAGGALWWSELRPTEAGRVQIVRQALDADPTDPDNPGASRDVLPDGFSARTRVHEYGGGAWFVHAEDDGSVTLFFSNWADQRLHRLDRAGGPDAGSPVAITPEPAEPHGFRFADGQVRSDGHGGRWVICVREAHGVEGATEARNELVVLPADGSSEPRVLVGGDGGPDFVSSPRLSPDGSMLAWVQWRHPQMPWDRSELWVADLELAGDGGAPTLGRPTLVAGAPDAPAEAITQPEWSPEGRLHFVSDADGWWNLFAFPEGARPDLGAAVQLTAFELEMAQPLWVFGQSSYCFTPSGDIVGAWRGDGVDRLGWLDRPAFGVLEPLTSSYTSIDGLVAGDGVVAAIAASFDREPAIVTITDPGTTERFTPADVQVRRPPRDLGLDPAWFSLPEHIDFATTHDERAYALYYPPANPDHVGPEGEAPPLVVMIHGGPTSAARPMLSLSVQYWTSRGFAVADVNYRGSTGYGRPYRDSLNGRWGLVDVDDCVSVARHLSAEGLVDGSQLAIRGGSAGGYTVLCALAFHAEFTAGCSLYGVADLEALALDTHKFESRYLDGLVGPYPERQDLYVARSPIHHTEQLDTPLLILQGLEDEVVPPAQAEMMVAALKANGVPHAYLAFEGEQHGFRQAANIRRALESELYFYSRVFDFPLAESIEALPIQFL